MKKTNEKCQLNIYIFPEEQLKIQKFASIHKQSINEYIIESVRERISRENEKSNLEEMTLAITPVLQELWDNDKDASYDEI